MLFSGWFGPAIMACSAIIFLSYILIPSGLEVIEEHGRDHTKSPFLVSVTSSPIFRAFIRLCGINHLIMSGSMMVAANGLAKNIAFWQWLVLAGEGAVALISALTALAVWRVRWFLRKT